MKARYTPKMPRTSLSRQGHSPFRIINMERWSEHRRFQGIVLWLRDIAKGESTAQLARELHHLLRSCVC
jgi:hypothetical protein